MGKTPRELYLSYLRKMPPHLQKEIRSDKRLWKGENVLRGPSTWEEARRVLEIEQREATHRATANAVFAAGSDMAPKPDPGPPKPQPARKTKGSKAETNPSVLATQPGKPT